MLYIVCSYTMPRSKTLALTSKNITKQSPPSGPLSQELSSHCSSLRLRAALWGIRQGSCLHIWLWYRLFGNNPVLFGLPPKHKTGNTEYRAPHSLEGTELVFLTPGLQCHRPPMSVLHIKAKNQNLKMHQSNVVFCFNFQVTEKIKLVTLICFQDATRGKVKI